MNDGIGWIWTQDRKPLPLFPSDRKDSPYGIPSYRLDRVRFPCITWRKPLRGCSSRVDQQYPQRQCQSCRYGYHTAERL